MGFNEEFHGELLKRENRGVESRTKPDNQPVRGTKLKALPQYDLVWFVSFTEAGGSWVDTSVDATGSFGASGDIPLFGQLNALFLRITKEQLADALALSWGTDLGRSYIFESKTNLMDAAWTSNMTFLGTGGDITVTTGVDQAQSFYRVVGE